MINLASPDELVSYSEKLLAERDTDKPCVTICGGTGCRASRGLEVSAVFRKLLAKKGLAQKVDIRITGCHGFCAQGPLVVLLPRGILYVSVTPDDVEQIITTSIENNGIIDKLTYKLPDSKERISRESEIPFYANQERIVFALLDDFAVF